MATRKFIRCVATLAVAGYVATGRAAPAQEREQEQERGAQSFVPNEDVSERFDSSTVTTVDGVVTARAIAPMNGGEDDVVLVVDVGEPGGDDLRARLGPEGYLDRMGLEVEPGDSVALTGSRISVEGQEILLVSKLASPERLIVLRRSDGTPLW